MTLHSGERFCSGPLANCIVVDSASARAPSSALCYYSAQPIFAVAEIASAISAAPQEGSPATKAARIDVR